MSYNNEINKMLCVKCGGREFVKNGFIHGIQCFKCKTCGWQRLKESRYSQKLIVIALALYSHGLSCRTIAKLFFASPNTVCLWVKRYSQSDITNRVTWDEVCAFVKSKMEVNALGERVRKIINTLIFNEKALIVKSEKQ